MLRTKFPYRGGTMSIRQAGEMHDQKTGAKTEWTKAVKLTAKLSRDGSIILNKDYFVVVQEMLDDPEFQIFLKDMD